MPNIYVEQQYVEVLGQANSKARVTQQYLEVLAADYTVYEESVNSSLGLTDVAANIANASNLLGLSGNVTYSRDFNRSIEDSNVVDDNVSVGIDDHIVVSSSINLAQTVLKSVPRSLLSSSSLVLVDSVVNEKGIDVCAVSTINLTDSILLERTLSVTSNLNIINWLTAISAKDREPVGDTLGLTDVVDYDVPLYGHITDDLSLTQSVSHTNPVSKSIIHYSPLSHSVSYSYGARNFTIEDDLSLISGVPFTADLTSSLNITDEALRVWHPVHTLNLVDTAIGAKSKVVPTAELDLSQTIATECEFVRAIEDVSTVTDAFTYYTTNACVTKSYNPFCGGGEANPMRTTLKAAQRDSTTDRVVLSWPNWVSPLEQVVLRAPEIDDIGRFATTRTYHESRGGYLSVYSNPIWPQISTILVTFIGLTNAEAADFQDFVYTTIGEEISLGDWNGYIWTGIIKNPEEPIVEDGKRGFTVSFEFEGTAVSGNASVQSVSLEGNTSYEVGKWFNDSTGLSDVLTYNMVQTRTVNDALGITDIVAYEVA